MLSSTVWTLNILRNWTSWKRKKINKLCQSFCQASMQWLSQPKEIKKLLRIVLFTKTYLLTWSCPRKAVLFLKLQLLSKQRCWRMSFYADTLFAQRINAYICIGFLMLANEILFCNQWTMNQSETSLTFIWGVFLWYLSAKHFQNIINEIFALHHISLSASCSISSYF